MCIILQMYSAASQQGCFVDVWEVWQESICIKLQKKNLRTDDISPCLSTDPLLCAMIINRKSRKQKGAFSMTGSSEERPGKNICAALLAHVDAGKTTLSEALLYRTGAIRKLGRVDHGDAFLDTDSQERERGITIFSKQAEMEYDGTTFMLLDTPGHVDFSAEMERTLQVLDIAILVISGKDGVQGHTATLWKLMEKYRLPVFIFVNKMSKRLLHFIHCKKVTPHQR